MKTNKGFDESKMPDLRVVQKYRRDTSEVSCCLKYVIFEFNVLFWLLGLGILAVGVWALREKDTFNNLSRITNLALDPAFILICVGTMTFIIGFTGCVGALRENTCLLACYAVFLALLLLSEMTVGILGFVFKDWIKQQATTGFQAFITHYREDPDQQNLIDWIQEDWLQCCGIEGPGTGTVMRISIVRRCWSAVARLAGSPFSCCRRQEVVRNNQCGYDVRKQGFPADRNIYERGCLRAGEEWLDTNLLPVAGGCVALMVLKPYDVAKIIYEKGCIEAAEEWFDRNLLIVASTAVCTAFAQILGICLAQNLRADIFAQKAKWH